jgi:hypothetical protein
MKRFIKYFFLTLLLAFLLIQFYPRPPLNKLEETIARQRSATIPANDTILSILKKGCFDCHSDHTRYPWYFNVQPMAMWLGHHIEHGKSELNFFQLNHYTAKKRDHKLEEIAEIVERHEMPLKSYTFLHAEARLTDQERKLLVEWALSNIKETSTTDH